MIRTEKNELLIGLIGDTHIPSSVPEIPKNIINDFKEKKIDYLFHLGDYTKYKVYNDLLETFGKDKVIGIRGNMDDHKLGEILPEKVEFNLFGFKIFMTHGMGGPGIIIRQLNKYFDLSRYDMIIFGHIHRPYNERWRDGKLYISPGTPTDKKFTDINSYGFLKISKGKVNFEIVYL
ncbi:MAG: metallophosphoesterase family protein [Promethearchaeota archaeon]